MERITSEKHQHKRKVKRKRKKRNKKRRRRKNVNIILHPQRTQQLNVAPKESRVPNAAPKHDTSTYQRQDSVTTNNNSPIITTTITATYIHKTAARPVQHSMLQLSKVWTLFIHMYTAISISISINRTTTNTNRSAVSSRRTQVQRPHVSFEDEMHEHNDGAPTLNVYPLHVQE